MGSGAEDEPGELVSLEEHRFDEIMRQLRAIMEPMRRESMALLLELGGHLLDGAQVDDDLVGGCLGFEIGEDFAPHTSRGIAEIAAFARLYPDLFARWSELGPIRLRLLATLGRGELDALAATDAEIRLPRKRKRKRLARLDGAELFALCCLTPPVAQDARERRRVWRIRLARLQAIYDEVEEHVPWWPDEIREEYEALWDYAGWALRTALVRVERG